VIAATANGIILSYSIFPIKQHKEEDNWSPLFVY
jgi:hypothetical protein